MTTAPPARSETARSVRAAIGDRYMRHTLAIYCRCILIVTIALLSISLTTDVASWVWKTLAAHPGASVWELAWRIGWIVLLRSTDLLPQISPISCFLGVLWAETSQTSSQERTIVWNTGRSPAQCVLPALLLALCLVIVQFVFDAHLRPAAVMTMENRMPGLQADGGRVFSSQTRWIVAGDDLVKAQISAGPPAAMRHVTIYRLTETKRLKEILTAESAAPSAEPLVWTLHNVRIWQSEKPDIDDAAQVPTIEKLDLPLKLPPVSLTVHGIHPQFLPFRFLRELAYLRDSPSSGAPYQTWFHSRFSRALFPGGMALLAASLSLLLLAYRVRASAVIAIALAGYSAHIAIRIVTVFGEHGVLSPIAAAWTTPLLLLLASALTVGTLRSRWSYRMAAG